VRRATDEVLFVAGDAGNGCYRVEDGLIKVTMMSRAGVERILPFLGPGAIVGELAIIDGRPRSASDPSAPNDETVAAGSFLSLKGRVARTLLELAEDFGRNVGSGRVVIHQKIGQSDLAAMTGIARENLSRVFNEWRRRKLVSRLSGYYCLENKARLKAEAEL
jgi:CRP-like cAMP-binding protein